MHSLKTCVAIYPPMLDLFVKIPENVLIENGVALDEIVAYSEEKHSKLHTHIMKIVASNVNAFDSRAGGATFNTQKILSARMKCYFFGIIGDDIYGEMIVSKMQNTQVNIQLDKSKEFKTPWAYVFINGDKRANIAFQESKVCYSKDALDSIKSQVNRNTVFYFVSFMCMLPNIVKDAMELYKDKETIGFCSVVNLSSKEIVCKFREDIINIIKVSDFIIGNRLEYYALAEVDTEESLIKWLDGLNVAYAITDGADEVIGKTPNGPLRRISPRTVSEEAFTNGAGDSFAAGFIGAMKDKEYKNITDILPLLQSGVDASYNHITSHKSG
ncbi:adenosine kinase [Nematocida ausubeli]|nr:adenosine kinase [Nematocida ausubeli]